jgi:hypothetical protein
MDHYDITNGMAETLPSETNRADRNPPPFTEREGSLLR